MMEGTAALVTAATITFASAVALIWYHIRVWSPLVKHFSRRNGQPRLPRTSSAAGVAQLSEALHEVLSLAMRAIETDVHERVGQLASSMYQQQGLLPEHAEEIIAVCLPQSALWRRYALESPREKAAIADYVLQEFIHNDVRSFVQASTAAIYLGQRLGTLRRHNTLFYTNSVVFPMAALQEGVFHQVYSFCGPIFDQLCGGWLFAHEDAQTAEELRNLFRRPSAPLTTAFLMPLAMKVSGGPYYARAESARMSEILIAEAKHIVIMMPAKRLYDHDEELPGIDAWNNAYGGHWKELEKRISIVISGTPRKKALQSFVEAFANEGLEVHWQDPASGKWYGTRRELLLAEDCCQDESQRLLFRS